MAVSFTAEELADLRSIAAQWGVAPALVAWSLVQSGLARARAVAPELGPAGLAIAAALEVLQVERNADPAVLDLDGPADSAG